MIFIEKSVDGKIKTIFFGNLNLDNNIKPYVLVPENIKINNSTDANSLNAMSSSSCYEITEQTDENIAFSIEVL